MILVVRKINMRKALETILRSIPSQYYPSEVFYDVVEAREAAGTFYFVRFRTPNSLDDSAREFTSFAEAERYAYSREADDSFEIMAKRSGQCPDGV